jgi:hypothetical protein
MPEDSFWACFRDMATQLSGDREKSEKMMDLQTADLRELPKDARDDLRGDLKMVVGELDRLATRISAMDSE